MGGWRLRDGCGDECGDGTRNKAHGHGETSQGLSPESGGLLRGDGRCRVLLRAGMDGHGALGDLAHRWPFTLLKLPWLTIAGNLGLALVCGAAACGAFLLGSLLTGLVAERKHPLMP